MGLRDRAKAKLRNLRAKEETPTPKASTQTTSTPRPQTPAVPKANPQTSSRFAQLAAKAAAGELEAAQFANDEGTDRNAYVARMKANGRSVELAGEGMNHNKQGIQFWGPVDNESSQAKAVGKVLNIDQLECITCGTCEENTKVVFRVPEEDPACVLKQNGPMDLIQDAIDACPVTCISWLSPTDLEEQHSHGGFKKTN
jgi:ferredoxin